MPFTSFIQSASICVHLWTEPSATHTPKYRPILQHLSGNFSISCACLVRVALCWEGRRCNPWSARRQLEIKIPRDGISRATVEGHTPCVNLCAAGHLLSGDYAHDSLSTEDPRLWLCEMAGSGRMRCAPVEASKDTLDPLHRTRKHAWETKSIYFTHLYNS